MVVERLKQRVAAIPGMTVYFQAVQDVQISTRSSRSQYQYTLTATDSPSVIEWSNKLVQEMRRDPMFRDVSSDRAGGRSPRLGQYRSPARPASLASRFRRSMTR